MSGGAACVDYAMAARNTQIVASSSGHRQREEVVRIVAFSNDAEIEMWRGDNTRMISGRSLFGCVRLTALDCTGWLDDCTSLTALDCTGLGT